MGTIYKRGQIFWVQYYRDGKKFRESSGSSKEVDAKRMLRLREGDIERGIPVTPRMGRVRFSELAEDMVADYIMNERRTLRDLRIRLKRHVLPAFGQRQVSTITSADMTDFVVRRQEEGASNGEINRELAIVRRCFRLGQRSGKVFQVPVISNLRENNVREGFFEREDFEAVRRHMPPELRGLVTFFYLTGCRRGEVLTLQWFQVDFKARTVYLRPGTTKNRDARLIPFTDELECLLREQKIYTDEVIKEKNIIVPWVFHREGRQIKSFRRSWLTACKRAGQPGASPTTSVGPPYETSAVPESQTRLP